MELDGCRVGVLVEDLFEDLELWYPVIRLREAGAKVMLLGTSKRQFRGKHGLSADADTTLDDVDMDDLDGLVIPGGYAPDRLRLNEEVLELIRHMDRAGKPLAFLCHAGSVLASAGILRNRQVTSYMSIRADLENAGALWKIVRWWSMTILSPVGTRETCPIFAEPWLKPWPVSASDPGPDTNNGTIHNGINH